MPNKTVTIHPAVEVPEGDTCFWCKAKVIINGNDYCGVWCEYIHGSNKRQKCKNACEREKQDEGNGSYDFKKPA